MGDIDFAHALATARRVRGESGGNQNLALAYLTALEALEYEVAGREHDLTAKILGPRMPDRQTYETDGRDW